MGSFDRFPDESLFSKEVFGTKSCEPMRDINLES